MGGVEVEQTQKWTSKRNSGVIAERKKKKKKRRRKEGAVIAKISKAFKESGPRQVGLSVDSRLNRAKLQKNLKERRRLRGRQKRGLLSDEASSEKEKQSLLAWVEMCMEQQHNANTMQDLCRDPEIGCSAQRILVDRASNGHTCSLTQCAGISLSGSSGNGDASASAYGSGTCGYVLNAQTLDVDLISNGCSKKQSLDVDISKASNLQKGNNSVSVSNSTHPCNNKRKREDDRVLQYVLKRNVVIHASLSEPLAKRCRTTKTVVSAWERNIPVTLTSEACTVQEWISSQNGNLFGLDVEWRPNRAKGQKNKVALLQLCTESECLIIQMLFLDRKPQALCKFLSDPSKSLAGVGVLADGKRLLHDYGLECQGGIELTALAVERLKRDELRNVGLKVLMQEVLGLKMDKPKKVVLSNWAKVTLDPAQINYACMDAWASFALSRKLLVDM